MADRAELLRLAERAEDYANNLTLPYAVTSLLRIVAAELRTAAAQPVQGEPVAWRIRVRKGSATYHVYSERLPFDYEEEGVAVLSESAPVYLHPPSSAGAMPGREALLSLIEKYAVPLPTVFGHWAVMKRDREKLADAILSIPRASEAPAVAREEIAALILNAMLSLVHSGTYGKEHAVKINTQTAEKFADRILALLASRTASGAGETPSQVMEDRGPDWTPQNPAVAAMFRPSDPTPSPPALDAGTVESDGTGVLEIQHPHATKAG